MSQPVLSEKQLAHVILRRLPFVTGLILSLQALVFIFISESQGGSLFGLAVPNDALTKMLAFDARSPARQNGLPFLSSFFVHQDLSHFFNNALFFSVLGCFLEAKGGKRALAVPLILGHAAALSGSLVAHHLFAQSPWVIGMSGGVLALVYPAARLWSPAWALLLVLFLAIVFLALSLPLAVSHVPALLVGVLAGVVLKIEKRP